MGGSARRDRPPGISPPSPAQTRVRRLSPRSGFDRDRAAGAPVGAVGVRESRQQVTVEIPPGDYAPAGHRTGVLTDCPLASGIALPVPFRKWQAMTTTFGSRTFSLTPPMTSRRSGSARLT